MQPAPRATPRGLVLEPPPASRPGRAASVHGGWTVREGWPALAECTSATGTSGSGVECPSASRLRAGALRDEIGEQAAVAETVVVAGAQQSEREPEVAFQRRQPFDERALASHLGQVAPAVDALEAGDLRAEAHGIGVTPLRLDGVLLLMVPMDQRQCRGQLRQKAMRPPLRDPTRIAPHDDDPAAVVGLGRGIDGLAAADRQNAKVRLRSTPSAG